MGAYTCCGDPVQVAVLAGLEGVVTPSGGATPNKPLRLVKASTTALLGRPDSLPHGATVTRVPRRAQARVAVEGAILA